jgi:hypothetical protein
MTAKHLAMKHSRQDYVIGKLRLARALLARVNLAKGLAYDPERFALLYVRLLPILTHNRR